MTALCRQTRLAVPLGVAVAMAGGCAGYGLSLVRPIAAPVSDDRPTAFAIDSLRYTVQSAEGHLVLDVYNPTDRTVRLDGRASSVVDPAGQSHPLFDQTIAPDAHVKVIEPPLRPWYGRPLELQLGGTEPGPDGPAFWDWPDGAGTVRLRLAFDGGVPFEHLIVLRRDRRQ